MLVAVDVAGRPVEAARDLGGDRFTCPACGGPVLLKRGRVVIAHFAHRPGAQCWSEPESVHHLRAKHLLATRFRSHGYRVRLEETHHEHGRRVDVAVTVPSGHRVAVEVQDSAISVETAKARTRIDKRLGFFATLWVFTDRRAAALLAVSVPAGVVHRAESRVPKEMLWVDNRYRQGLFVLDLTASAVWNLRLDEVYTRESCDPEGTTHYYQPRTLRCITCYPTTFALTARPGRYHGEWAVIFAPFS